VDLYQDATLQDLIRAALTNNYDVRIAAARLEQADAYLMQSRSQLFPQAGYEGVGARGKNSFLGNPTVAEGLTQSSFLGALNATWELDFGAASAALTSRPRANWPCRSQRAVVLAWRPGGEGITIMNDMGRRSPGVR
jgi:multidrug efflux system outer membrane protein